VEEYARRIRNEGLDPEEFLAPRRCMREPIPEIFYAAHLLDRAVGAHLAGDRDIAETLIRRADLPAVRAFTEMLWGSSKTNAGQWLHVRRRPLAQPSPELAKDQRIQKRMPSKAEAQAIIARHGYNCAFCGMPVIRSAVRAAISKAYPEALQWGNHNHLQHAAFQCMWLQFDHVLAHSRGGDNSPDNVVITCAPCNYGRGDWTLEEVGLLDPRTLPTHRTSWDGLERFLSAA